MDASFGRPDSLIMWTVPVPPVPIRPSVPQVRAPPSHTRLYLTHTSHTPLSQPYHNPLIQPSHTPLTTPSHTSRNPLTHRRCPRCAHGCCRDSLDDVCSELIRLLSSPNPAHITHISSLYIDDVCAQPPGMHDSTHTHARQSFSRFAFGPPGRSFEGRGPLTSRHTNAFP